MTEWLSDLKMGYCYDGWWLNQQFCCWEIDTEDDACDSWHDWSDYVIARWVIYVVFAVRFVSSTNTDLSRLIFSRAVGNVFVYRRTPRSVFSKIRRRFWDIRDQVYFGWVYNERVPRALDVRDKKSDFGGESLSVCLWTCLVNSLAFGHSFWVVGR